MSFLRPLVTQIVYIAPLFWFVELVQNVIFLLATGTWGWYYPSSPYHWFSFRSLSVWAVAVTGFWALYYFYFLPRNVAWWKRILIAGTVGWAGEWLSGFLSVAVLGQYLKVWNDSKLVFVKLSAWPFWCGDVVLYHILTVRLANLRQPEVGLERAG